MREFWQSQNSVSTLAGRTCYSVTSEYVNSVVTDVSEETVYALPSSSNSSVMVLPSLPMPPQFTGMAETSQPSALKPPSLTSASATSEPIPHTLLNVTPSAFTMNDAPSNAKCSGHN